MLFDSVQVQNIKVSDFKMPLGNCCRFIILQLTKGVLSQAHFFTSLWIEFFDSNRTYSIIGIFLSIRWSFRSDLIDVKWKTLEKIVESKVCLCLRIFYKVSISLVQSIRSTLQKFPTISSMRNVKNVKSAADFTELVFLKSRA